MDEYGLNLPTLTETDINAINMEIKKHGFEIACGLCFVDAKRYRVGKWVSTFTEGDYYQKGKKKGQLKPDKPGYNNLVRLITAKDKSADVGYSYFNYATNIPATSEKTIDQLDDSELDFKKLVRKMGRFAHFDENGRVDALRGYVANDGKQKNPTATAKMAFAIYCNPHMRHLLAQEDILASEGLDTLRAKNRTLYELVNAHWGTGRPKLPHGGTAYGNEIIRSAHWGAKNNFSAKAAYKVGGVRVQSFSDYEANMFFDYMQLFADMAARELPSHAYTKEATYARLFGMTGQKINLSVVAKAAELTEEQQKRYKELAKDGKKALLEDPEFKEIADHAGLAKDKNGNWTRLLVEDETFPLEEAKKIQNDPRYSSNCGIIWIGVSDEQIRVLLDSEDVPMVIPYHESGVSAFIKNARNLLLYKNYEDEQNTRNKSDGKKISGKDFDFYESLYRTNDPVATANEYKEWCEKHNYLPKFDQFKDHPNYYKLLVDFRVYDYNGVDPAKMANRKYLPQGAVTMTFPETREFNKLVRDSLAEQQGTKDRLLDELTTEQGSLISAVKDAIGLDDDGRRTAGEDVKRRSVVVDFSGTPVTVFENEKYGTDEDGKIYPVVNVSEITSSSIKNDENSVRAFVRNELRKLMGQTFTIKSDNTTVKCARDFAEEYVSSKSYRSLNVPNKRVKLSAKDNIRGIVENATNPVWKKNDEEKHNKDAARGWRYYDTAWIAKRRNEKGEEELVPFIGTLCVRMAKNGNDYIYDIINVKKSPMVGVADDKSSFRRSLVTSKNSVSQSNENGKRNSVNVDTDGNTLTPAQQNYFADSKVRDDDGRLKVMYHGSTDVGFMEFDPTASDDGISLFFTDKQSVASGYSATEDVLDIIPYSISFKDLADVVEEKLYPSRYLHAVKSGNEYALIEDDVDSPEYEGDYEGLVEKVQELISEDMRDSHDLGGNYKVYLNLENPYVVDANGQYWNELRNPYYDYYAQHEYNTLDVSRDSKTGRYSAIGTKTSGIKETIVDSMTLDEIEKKYGVNLRKFLENSDYYGRHGTSIESTRYSDISFDGEWKELEKYFSTRDIAQYAKDNGYDGVIFKNIVDIGKYGENDETSTVAIAFNSNQIKAVNNQNPTQDEDIRRAVGIDEFDFNEFGDPLLNELSEDALREWVTTAGAQEETKNSTDLISALRSSNEVLKGDKVNKADIRKIARQIKSQYNSNINVDTLAENLAKIFDYAQSRDYINYEDLATVITEVAAPVIDGSVNKVGAEEFDSFKNVLKGYTFHLDERQENEVVRALGSWGAFRKALPGIKFTRGNNTSGIALDSVWDELCEQSGYVLDQMVTSNDMPLMLIDAFNSMRPTYHNAFGEDAQSATEDAAMQIVSKYYKYDAGDGITSLPNGVTKIGSSAFDSCTSLTSITFIRRNRSNFVSTFNKTWVDFINSALIL